MAVEKVEKMMKYLSRAPKSTVKPTRKPARKPKKTNEDTFLASLPFFTERWRYQ